MARKKPAVIETVRLVSCVRKGDAIKVICDFRECELVFANTDVLMMLGVASAYFEHTARVYVSVYVP